MNAQIIFHIDEIRKWDLLLNNVNNLLLSYGESTMNVSIEILANSEAVKGYISNNNSLNCSVIESLLQNGVKFVACNNALLGMNISKEQIFPFVNIVPVGIRELVDKQIDGYVYLKP